MAILLKKTVILLKKTTKTPEQRSAFQQARRAEQDNQRYEENRRQHQAEMDKQISPGFIDAWLNDPRPLCPVCKQPCDSIGTHIDPFLLELYDRREEWTSCDSCYQERRDDI